MASVKFNRGLKGAEVNNPEDALAFLAQDQTLQTAKDYGYLYLGTNLVATKYLKDMDLTGLSGVGRDGLLEITSSGGSPILTTRGIIAATSSTYDWSNTSDVPTAKVIADYVSKTTVAHDSYHGSGTWGSSTNWKVYTSKFYVGGTEVTSGQTGYVALAFTLPVATTFSASDDTHLTTPKQIADYFAGLSGGMRYCGEVSSATLPTGSGTLAPYKSGDTFIASQAFTVGTSPQRKIESGDMVVLNSNYSSGNLAYNSTSGKWNFDQFERNLDGSVTKSVASLTTNGVAYGTGDSTIATTAAGAVGSILLGQGSSAAPAWLAKGTAGQILKTGSSTLEWTDHVYDLVALKTNTTDTITVTHYTNGSSTSTDIQIKSTLVKQTLATANEDRPILIAASTSPTNNAAAAIHYETNAKINPSTGKITATTTILTETSTNSATSGHIDTAYALTWQTLPNPSD